MGLGNPGREYSGTRHNLGEDVVRELARRMDVDVSRKRWSALVGAGRPLGPGPAGQAGAAVGERRVWMVLPQTFMNLSGRSVALAVRDLRARTDAVWVVHDELDLPLCRLRIRLGGSAAGNNGVRSVISSLGTQDFWRFRVGVGRPPGGGGDGRGVQYVLGRWSRTESERLPGVVAGVADALQLALREGPVRAMDVYNRSGSLGCEELP